MRPLEVGQTIRIYSTSGFLAHVGTIFHMTDIAVYIAIDSDAVFFNVPFQCVCIRRSDLEIRTTGEITNVHSA